MFDRYSEELFESLPRLSDIDADECKRWLTSAYLYCIDKGINNKHQQNIDIITTFENLRRLGSALESAAVFDVDVPQKIREASAFISAESLSLLSKYYKNNVEEVGQHAFLFGYDYIYTKIESALLYLIAGYDANAITEVREIKEFIESQALLEAEANSLIKIANKVYELIYMLCSFELWAIPEESNELFRMDALDPLTGIVNNNQFQMYKLIESSLYYYIKWLLGEDAEGYNASIRVLQKVIRLSSAERLASYATIYHLSKLLEATYKETSRRSMIHKVPSLPGWETEWTSYLKFRALGHQNLRSRPFLWPSTKQFVDETLPGPHSHSVVSMPTGSGKSFLAELAIAQALYSGWVLYLAPTNALTHQIRRDLLQGLRSLPNLDVRSFVGEEEYTALSSEIPEIIEDSNKRFIAVMTPEKCSLALRLTPQIFSNCSLCVFDEFHLIGESERGIISDLVLGQIISLNKTVKFLLMSAMMSNPDEIADWLRTKTGIEASIPTVKWKPTRTLRGAAGVSLIENSHKYNEAIEWLDHHPRRVNRKYTLAADILYCFTGVWQTVDEDNFSTIRFQDVETELQATRESNGRRIRYVFKSPSWTNNTAKSLGLHLARNKIPSIVFFPHDKNHVFSVGEIDLSEGTSEVPQKILDLIDVSERELGLISEVGQLLVNRGISVHSSAMLEAEKEASEEAFKCGVSSLMFATGTLAQGLNLPSVAVIIAGESVGDRRETGTLENEKRSKATILNAIGRAGRAGFSNQSLSIIVPDKPIFLRGKEDWEAVLRRLEVLGEHDATIRVESPLEAFLDRVIDQSFDPSIASNTELLMVSYLSDVEGHPDMKQGILNNTFAAYRKRNIISQSILEQAGKYVEEIKQSFIEENEAPNWTIGVARKAGVDFFTTLRFYQSMNNIVIDLDKATEYSIDDWLRFFILCMKEIPPKYLVDLFPEYVSSRETAINQIQRFVAENSHEDSLEWERPPEWEFLWEQFCYLIMQYMDGATLKELIITLLEDESLNDSSRSAGKPIPTILSVINGPIAKLSLFAGLFVAILEEKFSSEGISLPWNLSALPLAIKNGCNDYSSLCWYRFGVRYRVCSHLLAKSFPLNEDIMNDERARRYVRRVKKLWLDGFAGDNNNLSYEDEAVLESLRRIVR
ncbi:DEAD/DEAH box helicase [Cohnella hashimotonis]|uniref:DEAD/DEAH box helicase n=1 Tax=Cohnella hashimotonis TaxID=2826895 RepID=A0ABT6TPK3_9BACL|nr:DEAD/DEAH box helicase [Cohnella hashimotonis]MDI4648778.1 DEAD/DEAH box helicase [Cohnella hashimotonis]